MHGYKFSEILRANILIHAQIGNKKKKEKNHILISIFYFLLFYGVISIDEELYNTFRYILILFLLFNI